MATIEMIRPEPEGEEQRSKKSAEVIDISTRKPVEDFIEFDGIKMKKGSLHEVTRSADGKLEGLPEGLGENDVFTFVGHDGKLWAHEACDAEGRKNLMEEFGKWSANGSDYRMEHEKGMPPMV